MNIPPSFYLDPRNSRGVKRKALLYSFSKRNAPYGKIRVDSYTSPSNDNSRINLDTLPFSFDDTYVYLDTVTDRKGGNFGLELFLFNFLNDSHVATNKVMLAVNLVYL